MYPGHYLSTMRLAPKQILMPERVAATHTFGPAMGTSLVDATGTTDMTSLLSAALSALPAGATLKLFPGTYKLTTGTLAMPADRVTLDFTGCTLNLTIPSGQNWTTGGPFILFDGNSKQGFTIRGGKFVCTGDPANSNKNAFKVRVLSAQSCNDLILDRNECVGCTLGRFPYGNNIRISRPKGTNTETGINYQQGGMESFLLFPYTTNFVVSEAYVDGYGHGIQWDGGPNEGSGTGYSNGFATLDQTMGTGPGRVIGGTYKNQSGAGVWGSRGVDIVTSFVSITESGDCCWDVEGGIDCRLDNSYVENGYNAGCIATFGNVSGLRVTNTTIKVSTSGARLGAFYGTNVMGTNTAEDIRFDGCRFLCTIASTVASIGPDSQAFKYVAITNSRFTNARWVWHNVNSRTQRFENNRVLLTVTSDGPTCGSVLGTATEKPELYLYNNRIVSQASGNVGLSVFNSDGTYSDCEYLLNNRIIGFTYDLDLKATATSPTVSPVRFLRGNTLGSGTIAITNPSSGPRQRIFVDRNRRPSGNLWPKVPASNLAAGETVTASSAIIAASNLTNGSYTDYYSSAFDASNTTERSVIIDLRFIDLVGEVALYPRQDIVGNGWPVDYVVEVSADGGQSWTTVVTKTAQSKPTATSYVERLLFAPREADMVRVRATKTSIDPSNSAYVFQLAEVEIYAPGRPADTPASLPASNGLPSGGTTGQYLKKNSATNYDASFADLPALATASASTLGGVKVGSGLSIDGSGVLSAAAYVPSYLRTFNAAWMTTDNSAITSVQTLTSAQAQLFEFYADASMSVSTVLYEVSTAGATLTANTGSAIKNGFVLMDSAGGYLAHASGTTDFTSLGSKRTALNQSVNLTVGTKYYLLMISTGTTPVSVRVTDVVSGKASLNAGRSSAPYIYSTKTVDGITSGTMDLSTGWTAKVNNRPWVGVGS